MVNVVTIPSDSLDDTFERVSRDMLTELAPTALQSPEQIGVARRIRIDNRGICKDHLVVHYIVASQTILSAKETQASPKS
jgi:hypothetical protein